MTTVEDIHAGWGWEGASAQVIHEALGRTVTRALLGDFGPHEANAMHLHFDDGSVLQLHDGGQDCCETRYLHTDDALSDLVGGKLAGVKIMEGPVEETAEGLKECRFLHLSTGKVTVTVCAYNEHNGYYGGFNLKATWITSPVYTGEVVYDPAVPQFHIRGPKLH